MKKFSVVICLLAGCASQETIGGPGVAAALELPLVQFNGTVVLANEVAAGCPRYTVSDRQVAALINARSESTVMGLAAIDLEVDVAKRSFQARHGISVGVDNTCAAIDDEIAKGTALGAMMSKT